MRGKRAKQLRRKAVEYVLTVLKKGAGEGYGTYKYLDNRVDWTPMIGKDGHPMRDPDGQFLKTVTKVSGTILNGWYTRVVYRNFKRDWNQRYANRVQL